MLYKRGDDLRNTEQVVLEVNKVDVGGFEVAAAERPLHVELLIGAVLHVEPACVVVVREVDELEGEAGGLVFLVQHGHLLVDALRHLGEVCGAVAVDDVDVGVNLNVEDIAGSRLMGLAGFFLMEILVVGPLLFRGTACTATGGCKGTEAEEDGEEAHVG